MTRNKRSPEQIGKKSVSVKSGWLAAIFFILYIPSELLAPVWLSFPIEVAFYISVVINLRSRGWLDGYNYAKCEQTEDEVT